MNSDKQEFIRSLSENESTQTSVNKLNISNGNILVIDSEADNNYIGIHVSSEDNVWSLVFLIAILINSGVALINTKESDTNLLLKVSSVVIGIVTVLYVIGVTIV
jgi:hypothetical protein